MKKLVQKLGLAIALPFTMATSVAVAQCPTITSVNVSTGSNGLLILTPALSYTVPQGAFSFELGLTHIGNLANTSVFLPEVGQRLLKTNTFTLQALTNGIFNIDINYYDTLGCNGTGSNNSYYGFKHQVYNVTDSTSSCPKIKNSTIWDPTGPNLYGSFLPTINDINASGGLLNGYIIYEYTGLVSQSHFVKIDMPIGYTVTPAPNYNQFFAYNIDTTLYTAGGSYTLTLVDSLNPMCPLDVYVSPLSPTYVSSTNTVICSAYASFVMSADSTTQGSYNVYNYSTTSGTTSYLWDFGDGSTSTLAYPTHTYAAAGFYTISLTVTSSDGCSDTHYTVGGFKVSVNGLMTKIVVKNPATVGINEETIINTFNTYPNPMADVLEIELSSNTDKLTYSIIDALGKQVLKGNVTDFKTKVNTSELVSSMYFLSIQSASGAILKTSKLVK